MRTALVLVLVLVWHAPMQVDAQQRDFAVERAPAFLEEVETRVTAPAEIEIIGGEPSDDERVTAIRLRVPGPDGLCSGLLITDTEILTAAHCLCHANRRLKTAPLVTLADNSNLTKPEKWVEAVSYALYPGWDCRRPGTAPDLAVVGLIGSKLPPTQLDRLKPPNPQNDFLVSQLNEANASAKKFCATYSLVPEIPMLPELIQKGPRQLQAQGFGIADDGRSGIRRRVNLGVTSLACTSRHAVRRGCRPYSEMMMGAGRRDQTRHDTCSGDSGGPVFLLDQSGRSRPVAVVSRAVSRLRGEPNRSCLLGGVYTHIGLPGVLNWLKKLGVSMDSSPC